MDRNGNIFEILELKCSYDMNVEHSVLHIVNLVIPKGKIVFFVGPSGIGKSTILETLGLMNNTIASVKKFEYDGMDLSCAWKWSDRRLSDFRNREYSFIFQENNLMPNFSAYENVMITAMFQGMSKEESYQGTVKVLDYMQLPQEDRPIYSYSGGQRQRLAFARAILPNFSVLFGDEPTGNLDSGSAERLMNILTAKVRERHSTAIIVSHDLKLACEYADMIVNIRKSDSGQFGIIDDYSCYHKEDTGEWSWTNSKLSVGDLLTKLKNF